MKVRPYFTGPFWLTSVGGPMVRTTTIIITIIIIIIIEGDSLISWEEGSSLALVGNPSRGGVSIKILVWRQLKPNPQLL